MAIVSGFPVERNWNAVIDALKADIIGGVIDTPLDTRSGESLYSRANAQIEAYSKNNYANLMGKPRINGVEVGTNTSSEALGLTSLTLFHELVRKVAALENAIEEINHTSYLISRSSD